MTRAVAEQILRAAAHWANKGHDTGEHSPLSVAMREHEDATDIACSCGRTWHLTGREVEGIAPHEIRQALFVIGRGSNP